MSQESEELLEQALRQDLPSSDAQARLRRRLVAAGVAVGNGVAATTAAASGSAATGASVVGKVAGLSWGVKVGLAAAVAIPSVGLWLERPSPTSSAPQAVSATRMTSAPAASALSVRRVESQPAPLEVAPPATPRVPREERVNAAMPVATTESPSGRQPSQSDFAPLEPAPRASELGSTLAEETRLLDAAFAELARGNRARAAQLISEHESRYPQGLLQRERQRAKVRLSELSRGE